MSNLIPQTCCTCKTKFAISKEIYNMARARNEQFQFYCPNGHQLHFPKGESENDKLRRERDKLRQREAFLEDQIKFQSARANGAERREAAQKGVVTKLKKRAKAGLCPCCHRSFSNLRDHMANKHPDFKTGAEDAA